MTKKHKIILILLITSLATTFCSNFAFAVGASEADPLKEASEGPPPGGATLRNPLGTNNLNDLIARIIRNVLGIVGSLALLMFVIGGIMWMTSAGNEQRVKKGKDILTWATLGLVIIFTSYAILRFVFEVLQKTE